MNESGSKCGQYKDVIERYCPQKGENVIMIRSHGRGNKIECTNFEKCNLEKDELCGKREDK
ncbi:MAG: hypothetical protein IJO00_00865 [Clostridia bacterium]|nr:hypothetical protein [Clostridia bacterium]